MEKHIVKVHSVKKATHDVLHIELTKPAGYTFTPGQATEVAINKKGWENENRPFTFTGLPEDDYLEFHTKTYPSHNGVTNELLNLKEGDELILHDVWGAINYKGPGIFIAGGAGITPFISIFRYLAKNKKIEGNCLLFANKKKEDIILRDEFEKLLGKNFINILSEETVPGYHHGYITKELLGDLMPGYSKNVYVCGPPLMMDAVLKMLSELGVGDKSIVMEI
jgi:ferredoxin-NADP reductase